MNRTTAVCRSLGVMVAVSMFAVLGTSTRVATQGVTLSGVVTHVGVVVSDIDKAIPEYVRVMGFPTPKINDNLRLPIGPDGIVQDARIATMYMPNFFIEVV